MANKSAHSRRHPKASFIILVTAVMIALTFTGCIKGQTLLPPPQIEAAPAPIDPGQEAVGWHQILFRILWEELPKPAWSLSTIRY